MARIPLVEKTKNVKLHGTSVACRSNPMPYETLHPSLNVPVYSWDVHIVKRKQMDWI